MDDISTGIGCSLYGIEIEQKSWRKKLMNKFGIWKSMPLQTLITQIAYYTPVVTIYLLESHFKPNSQPELYQWGWLMAFTPLYGGVTNSIRLISRGIKHLVHKINQDSKSKKFIN